MSIRCSGCPARLVFDAATLAFLQTLPQGAHEMDARIRWCELEPGHDGQHYNLGQHSGEHEWWVHWPDGAERPTGVVQLAGCSAVSVPDAVGDDEVCTLFAGHPGRHNFTFDGRNLAPRIEPEPAAQSSRTGDGQGWTVHAARAVFQVPPWLRVDMVDVSAPNAERFEHARVHVDDAAIALIVDESTAQVLMLHRQRWVNGRDGYELLGGLVEAGEDPHATARREAVEESGYNPHGPGEHLLSIEPLPGIVDSRLHIYCWRHGAERITAPSDPHETGTITWMPLDRIGPLTRERQLLGACTALAVHAYLTSRARPRADPDVDSVR